MRILMLTQFYAPVVGGEERAVEDFSVELARRGHEVSIATLRLPGVSRGAAANGIQVHELESFFGRFTPAFGDAQRRHLPPVPDPQVEAGLRRIIAAEKPDVVHAHNWIVHSVPSAADRGSAPLLLSLHDYSLDCATKRLMRFGAPCTGPGIAKCLRCATNHYGIKGPLIAGGLLASSRRERRRVDMFLPVSEAVAEALGLARRGLRFEVVPNTFREREADDRDHADPLLVEQLPTDGFVLFLGDATEDKGAGTLIDAHVSNGALPLVFIGRPFGVGARESANVRVLGPWPHASALEAVRRCSMLVMPSLVRETFGIAALEAMAAGRPVVASDVGGLRELVVDGETGLVVPPGDSDALRNAIAALERDPARREALGEAGKARAALYSPENVVPRLEEVYGALLAGRRPAAGAENHVDH
jgi:glycosyltransferase involved in cell wall biosynthesis